METLRFMMVTTHYPPHHLGGDAVFVDYLSRELAKAGHDVHIVTFPGAYSALRGGADKVGRMDGQEPHLTEHAFSCRLPRMRVVGTLATGHSSRAEGLINSLYKSVKPDVVHWHNTKGFVGTPKCVGAAVNLYTAHDYYAICPRSNLLRADLSVCRGQYDCVRCHLRWRKPPPIWRVGSRRVLDIDRRIGIISPSQFLAAKFVEEGIHVRYQIDNFAPKPDKQSSTHDRSSGMLLYAGMLEGHKGVRTLLRGFHESKDLQGFRLTIFGEGSLRGEMELMVREFGIGDRVYLPGFVSREELDQMRRDAAYQIIPSEWSENAPLTAIEALASGVPLITSDQGGLPEMVKGVSDDLVFRGGDHHSLAECLVKAWRAVDEVNDRSARALRSYETRYLPEIHMRAYMDAARPSE